MEPSSYTCCADRDGWAAVQHLPEALRRKRAPRQPSTADYILPVWPTINCHNPARSDSSQAVHSAAFTSHLTAVERKASQFSN